MGTAAYMSPEQAKGRTADRRADIWSFGVLLAEMCTGQQLFTGETTAEVLASVIKDEARLDAVPASVRPIVERCLRRDPRNRWQAIGDVRIAIEESAAAPRTVAPVRISRWWRSAAAAWIVASIGVASAIAVAVVHFRETPQAPPNVRFQVVPTEKAVIATFAISPNGRHLAYRTRDADGPIWIRPMDSLDAQALPGTEGAAAFGVGQLFWSPDSEFVGFVAQGKLKKVSIHGGPPQALADAAIQTRGTWGYGGVILFVQGPASPIQRVPETGGEPIAVTKPGPGENHYFPHFLPDTRHFLYSVTGGKPEGNGIYVSSLDEAARPVRLLPDVIPAKYAPGDHAGETGYLVFVREATLVAQRFNADTLQVTGQVFPLAERVEPGSFSVSENGTLAFSSGAGSIRQQLVWIDRGGREIASVGPPGAYGSLRLSPDEKRIAFSRFQAGNSDIWIFDLSRGVLSRISSQPGNDLMPTWSPDGVRVVWSSNRSGRFHLYGRAASGAGDERLFLEVGALGGGSIDWSRDGRFVSYTRASEVGSADIWVAPQSTARSAEQKPVPYLHSRFNEGSPAFSPDGRWVAYESDESGRQEIYIQAFPLTDQKYQISTGGDLTLPGAQTVRNCFFSTPIAT